MRVLFPSTGNTGEVTAIDNSLTVDRVGDLAGIWYHVYWDDGLRCWVKATSVVALT